MESSTAAAHAGGAAEGEYEEVLGRLSSLITQKVQAHTGNRANQWDLMDRYLQILELELAIAWMKVIHVAGTKGKFVPRIREGELIPRTMPPTAEHHTTDQPAVDQHISDLNHDAALSSSAHRCRRPTPGEGRSGRGGHQAAADQQDHDCSSASSPVAGALRWEGISCYCRWIPEEMS